MRFKICRLVFFIFFISLSIIRIEAQDNRGQLPPILANTYISVNVGYIGYHFTNQQMEQG